LAITDLLWNFWVGYFGGQQLFRLGGASSKSSAPFLLSTGIRPVKDNFGIFIAAK